MQLTKNFKSSEFDSPDLKGSGSKIKILLVKKLQKARDISGIPYLITSGVRTWMHNLEIGGLLSSSHLVGWAVDIAVSSSRERHQILKGLILAGFTRIGISDGFIHVDLDPSKPDGLIWMY